MRRDLAKLTDFATVPAGAIVLELVAPCSWTTPVGIVAGALTWTFLEYWMHRALHRPPLLDFHLQHHRRPADLTGGTLYSSAIILALVDAGLLPPPIAAVLAGVLVGYFWFLVAHMMMHQSPARSSLLGILAWNHDEHHRRFNAMFGVSTSLWDRVFGTHQR